LEEEEEMIGAANLKYSLGLLLVLMTYFIAVI
jgi:hypothetical protein